MREREHSRMRMLERYGIDLTDELREQIRHQITKEESRFLYEHSLTRTVHEVTVMGKKVIVVWSKVRGSIVTVLPAE